MNFHKDFSKEERKILKQNGIMIYGAQWCPDENNDFTRGETGYKLNNNGISQIRTYSEVLEIVRRLKNGKAN